MYASQQNKRANDDTSDDDHNTDYEIPLQPAKKKIKY